jgi:dsDNA-specific endonuclease/ATPase MutS2
MERKPISEDILALADAGQSNASGAACTPDTPQKEWQEEPIVVPIEGSIDLHTFQPREVKDLLDDYLEAASAKGFEEVRIIHGKGSGTLKARVLSILSSHPLVESFRDAEAHHGGWGATSVVLKRDSVRDPQPLNSERR